MSSSEEDDGPCKRCRRDFTDEEKVAFYFATRIFPSNAESFRRIKEDERFRAAFRARSAEDLQQKHKNMLKHGVERASEVLRAAGARDIVVQSPLPNAGWHLLGTARMGTDPESSVVNEWGRAHDVKNLFIVDGSIFVTSAAVNPTPTIQALALYIADQIKARLANLFD